MSRFRKIKLCKRWETQEHWEAFYIIYIFIFTHRYMHEYVLKNKACYIIAWQNKKYHLIISSALPPSLRVLVKTVSPNKWHFRNYVFTPTWTCSWWAACINTLMPTPTPHSWFQHIIQMSVCICEFLCHQNAIEPIIYNQLVLFTLTE